ncbi:MAG: hypothetical protein K8I03_15875 [Ignavibacteria bacterium]|nr:hypothetical protein [Ignavibacteria bacterium]
MPIKIKAKDVERWAEGMASQSELPDLIRQLIEGTVDKDQIVDIEFPAYDSVQTPGPDGRLNCKKGNRYIPKGHSIWELSNQSGNLAKQNGKIDKDYKERTKKPINYDINKATFVFVTGHRCTSKHKWKEKIVKEQRNNKNKKKIWKSIKLYDSIDLEHWLGYVSYVTSIKIAKQFLRIVPQGLETLDTYGEMWCYNKNFRLTPELILTNRKNELDKLRNWLNDTPNKIKILTNNCKEAVVFIWAVIKTMPLDEQNSYFNKCLIINNEIDLKDIIHSNQQSILIYTGEDSVAIDYATKKHHILIPKLIDNQKNDNLGNFIKLKPIEENSFEKAMINLGLTKNRIKLLYKKCQGDLSKLKEIN